MKFETKFRNVQRKLALSAWLLKKENQPAAIVAGTALGAAALRALAELL